MPKKRQIPGLFPREQADGSTVWHWKPSPTQRKAGFVNAKLGTDEGAACNQAIDLNRQAKALREGATPPVAGEAPIARIAPRVVRFAELVTRYRAHPDFTGLRKATRDEYNVRLRQLEHWAMDGTLPVRDIDEALIYDLRTGLLAGSPFRAASTLRVLRIVLGFAKSQRIIRDNPAIGCKIPDPPSRKTRMGERARDAIVAAADRLGFDEVALAVPLAFWMIQRQADVLQLGRLAFRELENVDPRHAPLLADPRGRMMAFRLCQQKTGTWVDCPIPPTLHDEIRQRMKGPGGWLFADRHNPGNAMPQWQFQRRFREARASAADAARVAGDEALAAELEACQFRDLRRTGMIFYKDAGAKVPDITALSGHYVIGKKTILDTYMPGDTEGAIACVAAGIAGMKARELREKEA